MNNFNVFLPFFNFSIVFRCSSFDINLVSFHTLITNFGHFNWMFIHHKLFHFIAFCVFLNSHSVICIFNTLMSFHDFVTVFLQFFSKFCSILSLFHFLLPESDFVYLLQFKTEVFGQLFDLIIYSFRLVII